MPRGRPRKKETRSGGTDDLFSLEFDPLSFERAALASGYRRVAGVDEAGRGPLAGPVVAAVVILPEGLLIPGVADSKQLTEQERERLYDVVIRDATAYGIGVADVRTIDEVNILQATIIAMERAVSSLASQPDILLIDGNQKLPRVPLPQRLIVQGDHRSHSIAAASILAKVTRDRLMCELHERHPRYNFRRHKGYGTKEHLDLLREHGPCEAHRRSFAPVADLLKGGRT